MSIVHKQATSVTSHPLTRLHLIQGYLIHQKTSHQWATFQPHQATSHPDQAIYLIYTKLHLIHSRPHLIHIRLHLIYSRLHLNHTRLHLILSRPHLNHTRLHLIYSQPPDTVLSTCTVDTGTFFNQRWSRDQVPGPALHTSFTIPGIKANLLYD